MRNDRTAVIQRAIEVLDRYGLADLTMRRLGRELGVQPSAIYHHFDNKQLLLAAVADDIVGRRLHNPPTGLPWEERLVEACRSLHASLLDIRDAAEVVASSYAMGLGARQSAEILEAILTDAGFDPGTVTAGVDTLLHYVFGHANDEQTIQLAESLGAEIGPPRDRSKLDTGIDLIIEGLRQRR